MTEVATELLAPVSATEVLAPVSAVVRLKAVNVAKYVVSQKVKEDLAYTMTDLSDAMMKQSSMLIHYGTLLAKSSRQVDQIKLILDITEGKVYQALRAKAEKSTDAGLRRDVSVHSQVIAVKKALIEAEEIESIAKHAVEAFRHRRDMLIQQGLITRDELKGLVSISRREASDQEAEAGRERYLERARLASKDQ